MTVASSSRPPAPSARSAALAVLGQVLHRRQPLDQALSNKSKNGQHDNLEPRDRAFTRILVSTILRRLGQIDRALGTCLERPIPDAHRRVHDVLRLGAAQILFLGTPPHAAVDRTVALVPRRSDSFRGLVNAVLRRLARDGATLIADDDEALLNTPEWLWQSWVAAHGEEATRAIGQINLQNPPLDFTVKDPSQAKQMAQALDAQILPTGTLRRTAGGVVIDLPHYHKGEWWVQDLAAALPAQLLISWARGQNLDPATLSAIDLCAAPGGKTAQLAAAGMQVTAVDRSANRLGQLTQNLARLELKVETITADIATWRPADPIDLVLLDAPCSATGTARRHPDIPHLKAPGDVTSLNQAQARLIRAAAQMLKPGGVLVYAVCSLQPEEGHRIVDGFLNDNLHFTRTPITAAEVGGLDQCLTLCGDLLTLPCHLADRGGMDGFYAARLVHSD